MDKNKKNILIVSTLIIIFVICFLYFLPRKPEFTHLEVNSQALSGQPQTPDNLVEIPIVEVVQKNKMPEENLMIKTQKVELIVSDKNYEIGINEGGSVFEVMEKLKRDDKNFSFKYKQYPSLGIFVNEINNTKGGEGKYWIYYVNGEEATIGVSEYILKGGDIIKWELK